MIKTKHGGYSWYKKMTKQSGQIKGRAMLRKSVDGCAEALNIMWNDWTKSEKDLMGDDMRSKYAFAAYYIFKYLAETKEFDSIAELHGYLIHMLWRREDGSWVMFDNNLDGGARKIANFVTSVGQFMIQAFAEVPEKK